MPLRDDFPSCPRCSAALDRDGGRFLCQQRCGVLVSELELRELVTAMYAKPLATPAELVLEPPIVAEPTLTCPSCTTEMTKYSLYEIQIDRCSEHGIWFDTEELDRALLAVGNSHSPYKLAHLLWTAFFGPVYR